MDVLVSEPLPSCLQRIRRSSSNNVKSYKKPKAFPTRPSSDVKWPTKS